MAVNPRGVHFVGSIPLSNDAEVFRTICSVMPDRIKSIPDGETSDRSQWVHWQTNTFKHVPRLQRCIDSGLEPERTPSIQPTEVANLLGKLHTGYDRVALESFRTFADLKKANIIPSNVKFQVSVPTPLAAISRTIDPNYQAAVEPHWEAAFFRDLRRIQDNIPHSELAIQLDCMAEIFFLEGAYETRPESIPAAFGAIGPWFSYVKKSVFERLKRIVGAVDNDVALGFHFCYGDQGHKHFMEPIDTTLMVDVSKFVLENSNREVHWIHMPVPRDRTDTAYFEPLTGIFELLRQKKTTLFLGVVHESDLERTESLIATANSVIGDSIVWGVATECGMGRTPTEEIAGILEISKKVSHPA